MSALTKLFPPLILSVYIADLLSICMVLLCDKIFYHCDFGIYRFSVELISKIHPIAWCLHDFIVSTIFSNDLVSVIQNKYLLDLIASILMALEVSFYYVVATVAVRFIERKTATWHAER